MTNQNQKPDLDAMQAEDIEDDFDADQIADDAADDSDDIEDVLEAASNHCFPDDDADADQGGEDETVQPHKSSQSLIASWVIDQRLGDRLKPILEKKPHCLLIEPPDAT